MGSLSCIPRTLSVVCVDRRQQQLRESAPSAPSGRTRLQAHGGNIISWSSVSVAAQVILLAYFQAHEWICVPRWNGVWDSNPQARLDMVMGFVQIGLIVAVAANWTPAMALAVAVYAGWLSLQVVGWWVPYLGGASEAYMRIYAKHWARTWKFFPPIGDHPIPNAAHVVLQLLIVASLTATTVALVRTI